jgi:hypothetical protein
MTSALAVANGPVRLDAPAFQDRGLPTEAFVSRRLTLGSSNELAAVSLVIAPADPGVAPAARGPLVSRSGSSERPTIEQFVFQTSPTPADNPQIYRGRRATDGDAERTAYEFKR